LPDSFVNGLGRFLVIRSETKGNHYIMCTTLEGKRVQWVACTTDRQKVVALEIFRLIKAGQVTSKEEAKAARNELE
jgi:hypothetical protein